MRYMMFIKHTEDYRNADVPASLFEEMGKFVEETTKSGNFVRGAGLQPSSAGARVRLKRGRRGRTGGRGGWPARRPPARRRGGGRPPRGAGGAPAATAGGD